MALSLISSAVALCFSRLVPAQDPIVTDRPDFTESSSVVAMGLYQVESGLTYQREPGAKNLSGPEVLLRFGLGNRSELRIGLPDYIRIDAGGDRQSGFGDASLGAKLELGPRDAQIPMALIVAASLPTGAMGFSSNAVDPELALLASRDLGGGRALSGMIHVALVEEAGKRLSEYTGTLSLGTELGRSLGGFLELAASGRAGSLTASLGHLGLTHQPRPNVQWDVHAAFGLNRAAPDFLIGAGYSVRY